MWNTRLRARTEERVAPGTLGLTGEITTRGMRCAGARRSMLVSVAKTCPNEQTGSHASIWRPSNLRVEEQLSVRDLPAGYAKRQSACVPTRSVRNRRRRSRGTHGVVWNSAGTVCTRSAKTDVWWRGSQVLVERTGLERDLSVVCPQTTVAGSRMAIRRRACVSILKRWTEQSARHRPRALV